MQVWELIEALRRAPPDAVVVVAGDVIHGVELRRGRLTNGCRSPQFRIDPNGQDNAVVFTARTEMANGTVASMPR